MSGRCRSRLKASGLYSLGHGQGAGAQGRDQALEALSRAVSKRNRAEAEVVLDDQQHAVAGPDGIAVVARLIDEGAGPPGLMDPRRGRQRQHRCAGSPGRQPPARRRPRCAETEAAATGHRRHRRGRLGQANAAAAARPAGRVGLRQVQREGAAAARTAGQADFAPRSRDSSRLIARPQAGAAVLTAGRAVGLLESPRR